MAKNRVIVLTGVSRGLGRAMTEKFAELGHVVLGCSRSQQSVRDLANRFGPPHDFRQVDVCVDAEVQQWATELLASAGPPDLVLNNAALINRSAPLWEVPPNEFSQVVDANIKGVFHVIRHFLPAMLGAGSGVLVNFSSGWGRGVSPDVAPYCATKWAIEGMTQALASELSGNVAAIPLNPGVIHTEMLESCFGTHASSYPSPTQWALRAVPFLLRLSARENGQALTVPQ